MNLNQEKALFHLTGKLHLSESNQAVIEQLVAEAPYFAPARFFDTISKQEHKDREAAAQKTNLYFTNPCWLQYQLDDAEPAIESSKPAEPPGEEPVAAAEASLASVKEIMQRTDPSQETTGSVEEDPMEQAEQPIEITEQAESKISGILSSQLADFKKPVEADDLLEIDIEKKRLHTVDYFASQGIKIDLSSIPQDKLTTHLRKFTDWLRTVKNTHGDTHRMESNPEMERAVAETAKISNETREIVTETMADVLVKQGQTEKAVQLYIKLSFLNPEKSSYFAAKIEQLKGI
jgi:hypothetical protein